MTTRKITPHKGGRTARLYVRMTPDTKSKLEQILQTTGLGAGDWIENKVAEDEMKATIATPNGATITGKNLQDIKKQMNSMLSVSGPRGLTAITTTGTIIHVELYEGQDYIRTKDGRTIE